MFLFNFNSCNIVNMSVYCTYIYICIYILIYFQNNKNNVDYNLKNVILILHLK